MGVFTAALGQGIGLMIAYYYILVASVEEIFVVGERARVGIRHSPSNSPKSTEHIEEGTSTKAGTSSPFLGGLLTFCAKGDPREHVGVNSIRLASVVERTVNGAKSSSLF